MPESPGISDNPPDFSPPASETKERPPLSADGRNALLSAAAYLLFFQAALHFHQDSAIVVALSTLLSLWLTLFCVVSVARSLRSWLALYAVGGAAGLLAAPSLLVAQLYPRFPLWAGWRAIGPVFAFYTRLLAAIPGFRDLLLILFAAAVGVAVSRLVREIKILLPIGAVLALVDLYVVFGGGLVAQAQQGSPTAQAAMKSLTVALPTVQKDPRNAAPIPVVGFADYLFLAVFFACFLRFGVPARRTFFALCGVLAAYMLYGMQTATDLPALVPIAAVVIALNLRRFRYERAEAFALLYAGLLILGIFGFLAWRR